MIAGRWRESVMIQEVKVMPGRLQVIFSGSLHAEDAKLIKESLFGYVDEGHKVIAINLSGVDYIDGTGLEMLRSVNSRAVEKGGRIEIKALQGMVKDILELTGLSKVLDIK